MHTESSSSAGEGVAVREIPIRDALREAMSEEMRHDDRVFLMGEEVGAYNGAYKCSRGMLEESRFHSRDKSMTEPANEGGTSFQTVLPALFMFRG